MLTPATRRYGFSLIEVIVVLAVMGFLLAAVVPGTAAWLRNTQIRNAAESVQNGLQRARNEAVRRNRSVRFSFVSLTDLRKVDNSCALSSSAGSWVVSLNDPAGKCGAAASDSTDPMIIEKYAVGDGASGVTVKATTNGTTAATSVSFDGFGRVVSGTSIGQVDITNPSAAGDTRALRVQISAGGNIRMCDPSLAVASDPRGC